MLGLSKLSTVSGFFGPFISSSITGLLNIQYSKCYHGDNKMSQNDYFFVQSRYINNNPYCRVNDSGSQYIVNKPCFIRNKKSPKRSYYYSKYPDMYTEFDNVVTGVIDIPPFISKIFKKNNNSFKTYSKDGYIKYIREDDIQNILDDITSKNSLSQYCDPDYNTIFYNLDVLYGLCPKLSKKNEYVFDKYFVQFFIRRLHKYLEDHLITDDNIQSEYIETNLDINYRLKKYLSYIKFKFSDSIDHNYLCVTKNNYEEISNANAVFNSIVCQTISANSIRKLIGILISQMMEQGLRWVENGTLFSTNYDLYNYTLFNSLNALDESIKNNIDIKLNFISDSDIHIIGSFAAIPYVNASKINMSQCNNNNKFVFLPIDPNNINTNSLGYYI